ncbi:MAG: helix-turn-helix domain-containing protein [Lachnospiraceae bacterium]
MEKSFIDGILTTVRKLLMVNIFLDTDEDHLMEQYTEKMKQINNAYVHSYLNKYLHGASQDCIYQLYDIQNIEHLIFKHNNYSCVIGPYIQAYKTVGDETLDTASIFNHFRNSLPCIPDGKAVVAAHLLINNLGGNSSKVKHTAYHVDSLRNLYMDYSIEDAVEQKYYMETINKRYQQERGMSLAVQLGDSRKALECFDELRMETKQISHCENPFLSMRISLSVVKTMCRLAAERGGASPIAIDILNHDFTERINKLSTISEMEGLMRLMVSEYSMLVSSVQRSNYSKVVGNAISFIYSALNMNLSLSIVAKEVGVNANYLSSIFKMEVGMSITKFINCKRMEQAAELLLTDDTKISDVAIQVGIDDVNYFSKLFKQFYGKTPSKYKQNL